MMTTLNNNNCSSITGQVGVDHLVDHHRVQVVVQGCWTGLEHSINHVDGGVLNGYRHHHHHRDREEERQSTRKLEELLTMVMMKKMSVVKISDDIGMGANNNIIIVIVIVITTITMRGRHRRLLGRSAYHRTPTTKIRSEIRHHERRSETVAAGADSVALVALVALVVVVARPYSAYGTVVLGAGGVYVGVDRSDNSFGYSGGKIGSSIWRIKKHVSCSCCCSRPTL
mmetsp:Transcript_45712/g.111400  ORF Transcript_45712/g.111400 Transcript_45712/m.111400 type:complete len:227 (-) Transcript_45712:3677-4357(-)